jgi:uncharacterized protein (UPF0248 family)
VFSRARGRVKETEHGQVNSTCGREAWKDETSSRSGPILLGVVVLTNLDVLNKLRWAEDHDISQYTVGYLDRFGGLFELPATSWIRESTEEEWIPQHRIRYFKRVVNGQEDIVWHRDRRIDKIFGTGVV